MIMLSFLIAVLFMAGITIVSVIIGDSLENIIKYIYSVNDKIEMEGDKSSDCRTKMRRGGRRMRAPKFIVSQNQILDAVEYALELNIQNQRILNILMQDVTKEVETVLNDDCEEVEDGKRKVD